MNTAKINQTTKPSGKGNQPVPSGKKLAIVPGSETGTEAAAAQAKADAAAEKAAAAQARAEAAAAAKEAKEAEKTAKAAERAVAKIERDAVKAQEKADKLAARMAKPKKLNYTVDPDGDLPMPTAGNGSVNIYGNGYLPVPAARVRAMRILMACDAADAGEPVDSLL